MSTTFSAILFVVGIGLYAHGSQHNIDLLTYGGGAAAWVGGLSLFGFL